jgi:hypothetical protein
MGRGSITSHMPTEVAHLDRCRTQGPQADQQHPRDQQHSRGPLLNAAAVGGHLHGMNSLFVRVCASHT